jgi:hypothetical protein
MGRRFHVLISQQSASCFGWMKTLVSLDFTAPPNLTFYMKEGMDEIRVKCLIDLSSKSNLRCLEYYTRAWLIIQLTPAMLKFSWSLKILCYAYSNLVASLVLPYFSHGLRQKWLGIFKKTIVRFHCCQV